MACQHGARSLLFACVKQASSFSLFYLPGFNSKFSRAFSSSHLKRILFLGTPPVSKGTCIPQVPVHTGMASKMQSRIITDCCILGVSRLQRRSFKTLWHILTWEILHLRCVALSLKERRQALPGRAEPEALHSMSSALLSDSALERIKY